MRTLLAILVAGVYKLPLLLTIEAAGINRSLKRIEHENRRHPGCGILLVNGIPASGAFQLGTHASGTICGIVSKLPKS